MSQLMLYVKGIVVISATTPIDCSEWVHMLPGRRRTELLFQQVVKALRVRKGQNHVLGQCIRSKFKLIGW